MRADIYHYLLARPALLQGVAGVLWRCGCFGLFAAVVAAAVNVILGVVNSISGTQGGYQQLFTGIPTWWVPESALGIAFYVSVMFAGYVLDALACQLRRMLEY